MLYRISNTQTQVSKAGKSYWTADLTDDNGQQYERVATFNPVFKDGQSIDGFLESSVFNGKTSYTFKPTASVSQGGKSGQIERVMEKKNESIANFQDAKEKSIQHAGAITNATNLLIAMTEMWVKQNQVINEEFLKTKLRELIIYYKNLYQNPSEINPSSGDVPF